MKKLFSIVMIVVLMASVVSFAAAQGQRSTAFQIMNLGTNPAVITIYYYKSMNHPTDPGGLQCQDAPAPLASFDSIGYNQSKGCAAADKSCICDQPSWQGSVVIESTEPIAVITNIAEAAGVGPNVVYAGSAYDGIGDTKTANTLVLPLIYQQYYNFNTDFAIQNAGGGPTQVTIKFYAPGSATPVKTTPAITIAAGASYYRNQKTEDADIGPNFIGAAVVESTAQPIAAVVNENPNAQGSVLTYEGIASTAGGTNIYMPFLARKVSSFSTAFKIVALEPGTVGQVKLYRTGETTVAATLGVNLGQYQSLSRNLGYNPDNVWDGGVVLPDNWLGWGTVELTAGKAVIVVNERGTLNGRTVAMVYSGMNSEASLQGLTFPYTMRNYTGGQWYTGFQVVNTGAAGNVTVYYDGNSALGYGDYNWTTASPLAANAALECNQKKAASCGSNLLPATWVGSVRVVGVAGVKLVGICNERSDVTIGDSGLVYNGFAYTP